MSALLGRRQTVDHLRHVVSLFSGESCNGAGVTIADSDKDLDNWKDRAKSARVFYLPIPYDSYPNNAVA